MLLSYGKLIKIKHPHHSSRVNIFGRFYFAFTNSNEQDHSSPEFIFCLHHIIETFILCVDTLGSNAGMI